jgi:DNA end-binding protein Ku
MVTVMSARAIWTGAIAFNLVTVPVKAYGATEEKSVTFHQVHSADGSRIEMKRYCKADGKQLGSEDVAKGFELETGDVVIVTDKDLGTLPAVAKKSISVEEFVPGGEIDPVLFIKSYYLVPEKVGVRAYVLMREALEASGLVGIARFAMRDRERLATVRIKDRVMVLETMFWPDEIRPADFDFFDVDVTPKPEDLKTARMLIDAMTGDWDPAAFHDNYRESVQELIEAKVEGRQAFTPAAPADESTANLEDFMAQMKASIKANTATRPKPPRTAAKKTAKKTTARSSTRTRATANVTDRQSAKTARKKTTTKKAAAPHRSA